MSKESSGAQSRSPTPVQPRIVASSGPRMTLDDLKESARRAYPEYEVTDVRAGDLPNQAVEIRLQRGQHVKQRLFDPFTGEDLGYLLPAGFRFTLWLLDFHDNLLNGETGRRVNAVGGLLVILLGLTGTVIWWPGIKSWRRSLTIVWNTSWKQVNWHLHSALGFWSVAFILMWGVTGLYLSFPQPFSALVDFLQPLDESNPVERLGDKVLYWLAYLHFGRFGGRVPSCRATCNSTLKLVWAVFALVPVVMFVTGAVMWWNRVIRAASPSFVASASARESRPASRKADCPEVAP